MLTNSPGNMRNHRNGISLALWTHIDKIMRMELGLD